MTDAFGSLVQEKVNFSVVLTQVMIYCLVQYLFLAFNSLFKYAIILYFVFSRHNIRIINIFLVVE